MSSSDEETLDPIYVEYQRRLYGLPPTKRAEPKGKQVARKESERNPSMDWESTSASGPPSTVQQDEDSDNEVYKDPDDRTPTPTRASATRDRSAWEEVPMEASSSNNQTQSNSRFRSPLRNVNARPRGHYSSTRRGGRNFGSYKPPIVSTPAYLVTKRSIEVLLNAWQPPRTPQRKPFPHLPARSLPPRPNIHRGGRSVRQEPSSHHATIIRNEQNLTEPPNDVFVPPPLSNRYFYHAPRHQRPLEVTRLADTSHLIAEQEDSRITRSNRKKKSLAFYDTFTVTLERLPRRRRLSAAVPFVDQPQLPQQEQERDDVGDSVVEEKAFMLFNNQPNIELDDPVAMPPSPDPPPRPLLKARKQQVVVISDSEPGSAADADSSPENNSSKPKPPPGILLAPPPNPIIDALRNVVSLPLQPTLPFLRRNLKKVFHRLFINHMTRRRALPKVPSNASRKPPVHWEYRVNTHSKPWEIVQGGWNCHLCAFFPPFTVSSALMYHLHRDHPSVRARRKKLGFQQWIIIINLPEPTFSSSPPDSAREPSPLERLIMPVLEEPPQTEDEWPDVAEGLAAALMDMDMDTEIRRYRVGGIKCYDLAMQEMPMPLKGLAAKALEGRENDLCFYPKCTDKEKAMAIIWGRWVCVHRLEFIREPLKNTTLLIDKHWDVIRRTAEQEGLVRWLLTMKFHRYFTQSEVAQLSKRYQRHLP